VRSEKGYLKWLVTEWKVPLVYNADMNLTNLIRIRHGHGRLSTCTPLFIPRRAANYVQQRQPDHLAYNLCIMKMTIQLLHVKKSHVTDLYSIHSIDLLRFLQILLNLHFPASSLFLAPISRTTPTCHSKCRRETSLTLVAIKQFQRTESFFSS